MVNAWWLVMTFFLGAAFGIFLVGLMAGNKDDRK